MNIDGNLTEEEWIETYKYQVTENQVTETSIYSHFGERVYKWGYNIYMKTTCGFVNQSIPPLWTLYGHSIFDKHINKQDYPDFVNKGIHPLAAE